MATSDNAADLESGTTNHSFQNDDENAADGKQANSTNEHLDQLSNLELLVDETATIPSDHQKPKNSISITPPVAPLRKKHSAAGTTPMSPKSILLPPTLRKTSTERKEQLPYFATSLSTNSQSDNDYNGHSPSKSNDRQQLLGSQSPRVFTFQNPVFYLDAAESPKSINNHQRMPSITEDSDPETPVSASNSRKNSEHTKRHLHDVVQRLSEVLEENQLPDSKQTLPIADNEADVESPGFGTDMMHKERLKHKRLSDATALFRKHVHFIPNFRKNTVVEPLDSSLTKTSIGEECLADGEVPFVPRLRHKRPSIFSLSPNALRKKSSAAFRAIFHRNQKEDGEPSDGVQKRKRSAFTMTPPLILFRRRASKPTVKKPPAIINWRQMLLHSQMHGLSQFVDSSSKKLKVFWLAILFVMISVAIFHLAYVLAKAVDNPTFTQTTYYDIKNISYPPMTICLSRSYMLDINKLLMSNISLESVDMLLYGAPFFGPSMFNNKPELQYNEAARDLYDQYLTNHNATNLTAVYNDFFQHHKIPCQEFFLRCQNADRTAFNCCDFFDPIYSTELGLCYTQNYKMPKVIAPRRFSMFYIYINITHNSQYFEKYSNQYRLVVYLGSSGPEQAIWPSSIYHLTHGWNAHFSIDVSRVTSDNGTQMCSDTTKLDHFANYTLDNCMWEKLFFQNRRLNIPNNCTLPVLELTKSFKATATIAEQSNNYCLLDDIHQSIKSKSVEKWMQELKMSENNMTTLCPVQCDRMNWDVQLHQFQDSDPNQIHITIGYRHEQYQHTQETVAMDWRDYLSQVGGIMGLWLGCSCVTILHFMIGMLFHVTNYFLEKNKLGYFKKKF